MKPTILFVDDEPKILDSLRLSLRPLRAKWDIAFALGGQEALLALAKGPVDMLVTDMRMPGMDGAQLLEAVRALYPETIRMILSGYSDEENVLKTVKLAHQYLSKPCRPVDLIQAMDQALRLRDVLAGGRIKSVIAGLDSLPVLHPVYTQLVAVLQNENTTLTQVGDIIGLDVGLCASILRLVNSAFFGLPERLTNIQHAVKLLGSQTLQALVLSTSLFAELGPGEMPDFSVTLLWEHSLRVACFARAIGEREGLKPQELDVCFIAGLLHDIGKLILGTKMRRELEPVLARVRAENRPPHAVERELLGVSHAEVGAYLMALWGFDNSSMDAVCWHHSPDKLPAESFSPLSAVMAANRLDHELVIIHPDYHRLPFEGSSAVGYEPSGRLDAWRELCLDKLKDGAVHV